MTSFQIPVMTSIQTPAFIVLKEVVERNCKKMIPNLSSTKVNLRAHTKTHKTIEGVRLQTGGTCKGLVCSTLAECEFYEEKGCDDILYGFPLISHHMERVTKLVAKLNEFHVMIDSVFALDMLLSKEPPKDKQWSVFIAIDGGYGREGISWDNTDLVVLMARKLKESPLSSFKGIYLHCGGTYGATPKTIQGVKDDYFKRLNYLASCLQDNNVDCGIVGIGSTPTCLWLARHGFSVKWDHVNEIHPGNYIFCDLQQVSIGGCSVNDVACYVATRVIGHYPVDNKMIVDCGFTGLTKQGLGTVNSGYGSIQGEPNLILSSMSQEHGVVTTTKNTQIEFKKYPIGSILKILPWHACATANQYSEYLVMDGKEIIIEKWKPVRGW